MRIRGVEEDAGGVDGFRRVLGPFDATCIVIGAIIGVGIFFTPTDVAAAAGSGPAALAAWTVGGAIALLGALTFAELGALYPNTGGQYQILRDAWGPLPAFLFVFCNATAVQAGAIAIIAVICVEHLVMAVSGAPIGPTLSMAMSLVLIGGIAGANSLGVKLGSGIQKATVLAKAATLLAVTALALCVGAGEQAGGVAEAAAPAARGALGLPGAIAAALVPAFFAYGGWQHALWIAGEIKDPRRNVPLAIIAGVGCVVALYLLVNWAYLHLLGYAGVSSSQTLAADAVARAWPGAGSRAVAGAVAISALGVLNAQLLSGPRLIQAMAADGRFFAPFALVSRRFATPLLAILLLAAMAALVLFIGSDLETLLSGVIFIDGIFLGATGAAIFRLKRPRFPAVAILFVVGEAGVVTGALIGQGWIGAAAGAGWIAAAAVLYFVIAR